MNIDNLTHNTQQVLQQANLLCIDDGHPEITNAHLLKAIIQVDQNIFPYMLSDYGIKIESIAQDIDSTLKSQAKTSQSQPAFSREGQETLNKAYKISRDYKDEYITIEHLILALAEGNSSASDTLKKVGLTSGKIKQSIEKIRKGGRATSQNSEETYNTLEKYAKNLNQLASNGKLDPVIGRDGEIRRVLQILSRRTKNNPLLVGEPGVGKTAIAEGLAHRIIKGDVPEDLKNKVIYSLDMGALLAGAKYKGEFEERLKGVVKKVTKSDGEILLFIDEIHTLVGAGGGEGAMDAGNILKPALARGELRTIGATTLGEYQKYFEKDKALERRFQKVMVLEPDTESAISILRGIKDKYESHHKVRIKDEAIVSAVKLSQRYITDRFLPDKAIDLIDESAAKIRIEINSKPEELDKLDRKIMQLEIELEAIKKEKDQSKVESISKELSLLKEERNGINSKWMSEKKQLDDIQQTKSQIEQLNLEAERAERAGAYEKVAEIRYGKIKELEHKLSELQKELDTNKTGESLIREEITEADICEVISKWTGIPVNKLVQSEKERVLNLEQHLEHRVVGQEEAIELVSDAIRRSYSGINDEKKPLGSFLFLGNSGVGKTELAKSLAEFLFNDENSIIRIDMSEYQEKHAVSRLIGAPPGYVGYDEGGQLTEAVRNKPYSVVLFDEIEKAHPDVFNTLLQVLDDGRLTDSKGRVVNFKNTILIMTSNMGVELIDKYQTPISDSQRETLKKEIIDLLKQQVRPEFINRIDDIVVFNPLSETTLARIIQIQINQINKQLEGKGIQVTATEAAIKHISKVGYDPVFGARPIKRLLQKSILNEISKEILRETLTEGSNVTLDVQDNVLSLKK